MNDYLEIITKVNSFYTGAFSQLVIYTAALLAFVGILIPIIIQFYQNRAVKLEKENLEHHLTELTKTIKSELLEKINNEISTKFEILEDKLNIEIAKARASSFLVQGQLCLDNNKYNEALNSYMISALLSLNGKDEMNLQSSLEAITTSCLPHINNQNKISDQCKTRLNDLLQILGDKRNNINGRYEHAINNIDQNYKKAEARMSIDKANS